MRLPCCKVIYIAKVAREKGKTMTNNEIEKQIAELEKYGEIYARLFWSSVTEYQSEKYRNECVKITRKIKELKAQAK